mmetsp:Transcript_51579/g.144126  ORF Transcript_51579/g.144126 Transcript_51579/m.144126 type:complete len:493 (-) Transcript_51579:10-1488(-)
MARRSSKLPDFYQVLQVSLDATTAEIRSAYRRNALLCHPDKGGTVESFQLLVCAFETLADEVSRAGYERTRLQRKAAQVNGNQSVSRASESAQTKRKKLFRNDEKTDPHRFVLRLNCGVERLRSALQMVDSTRRKLIIEGLSVEVRDLLLRFMSHGSQSAPDCSAASSGDGLRPDQGAVALREDSASDCGLSVQSTTSFDSEDDAVSDAPRVLALEGATKDIDTECPVGTLAAPDRSGSTFLKGVDQLRRGRQCSYRARLMFACLAFYTKYQPLLDVAIEHHILLVQIKQIVHSTGPLPMDAMAGNRILSACQQVLGEANTCIDEIGLHVHVRLSLLGNRRKIKVSSPVLPLEEAVFWRERLLVAKAEGWSSFRPVWLELLQHPSFKPGRRDSATEVVEQLDEHLEAHWHLLREHRAPIPAVVRSEGVVAKTVRNLQRTLAAKAAAERREARRAAKTAVQMDRERLAKRRRWLMRKPGRDMTMDDLLHGVRS